MQAPGPIVCEIIMEETQPLIPRVSSLKKPDGTIISKPIEDLYPFLSREEFLENMIVAPKEILSWHWNRYRLLSGLPLQFELEI